MFALISSVAVAMALMVVDISSVVPATASDWDVISSAEAAISVDKIERLEEDHHNLERRQSDHGRAIGVISEKQASVQHELSDLKQEVREDMQYLRLSLDRILDIITKK